MYVCCGHCGKSSTPEELRITNEQSEPETYALLVHENGVANLLVSIRNDDKFYSNKIRLRVHYCPICGREF